ncbi:MAG: deoxyribodipyrimidine photolyase [Acidobacteria bacterium]|nr:MAG: deoxyribodipyrimidine photolyase [Acidobacteriota bacterium]
MLDRLSSDPRVTVRRPGTPEAARGPVVYWMQRAARPDDNPALDTAVGAANELGTAVVAIFNLVAGYPRANFRHYQFLAEGFPDIAAGLKRRKVGFVLRADGDAAIERFSEEVGASLLVGDENPLRDAARWRERVAASVRVPFWTVDADVIVPSRLLEKEQYAARTIRPRLMRQLEWYLVVPWPQRAKVAWVRPAGVATLPPDPSALQGLPMDRSVGPAEGWRGGPAAGRRALRRFVRDRLAGYDGRRNEPEKDGTSRLSPYLHFGHLGPREVALAVREADAPIEDRHALLEQLVVRRELAVNFVRFNPSYDRLEGCEKWALRSLDRHRGDPRETQYPLEALEAGVTHDPLWNAGQRQMVRTGWMHNYVRMYWAKKILEWTASPEQAFDTAVMLNDRYQLDGRDPNGYAGIAWSIGGKHDRPWPPERPIFGLIRYMSFASTSRKFDSREYIRRMSRT